MDYSLRTTSMARRVHGTVLTHRLLLLEHVDTIVAQALADAPELAVAIELEAHLVERTDDAAVGELVALQIRPIGGVDSPALSSLLRDIAIRIQNVLWQVTAVVPDIRSADSDLLPLSA